MSQIIVFILFQTVEIKRRYPDINKTSVFPFEAVCPPVDINNN